MTCIEYLKQTRPEYVDKHGVDTIMTNCCPSDYMNISDPEDCWTKDCEEYTTCKECWGREFVEKKKEKTESVVTVTFNKEDKTRLSRLCGRVGKTPCEVISGALKFYEDTLDAIEVDSNETH